MRQLWHPLTLHCPSDKRSLCLSIKRHLLSSHLTRQPAQLPVSNPHRRRHGGASADGLLTSGEQLADLGTAARDRWGSMKSPRRYIQPARQLRQLLLLSTEKLLQAKRVEPRLPHLLQALPARKV